MQPGSLFQEILCCLPRIIAELPEQTLTDLSQSRQNSPPAGPPDGQNAATTAVGTLGRTLASFSNSVDNPASCRRLPLVSAPRQFQSLSVPNAGRPRRDGVTDTDASRRRGAAGLPVMGSLLQVAVAAWARGARAAREAPLHSEGNHGVCSPIASSAAEFTGYFCSCSRACRCRSRIF